MSPLNPALQQRRRGCLTGCFTQSLAALAFGLVVAYALYGLLAPWGFYLGSDTFHAFPSWGGWGRMHSANVGDYALYVRIQPSFRGSRVYPGSYLTGNAWLCTSRGEFFRMHLGGGMRAHLGSHLNGEKVSLYMYNWPIFTANFTGDRRPGISFHGQWQNPNLVLDDGGSLNRAFLSDGSVYRGNSPGFSPKKENVPLILEPNSWASFKSTCSALAHPH